MPKLGGGGGEGLGGFGPHGGPFPGSLPSSAAPEGSVEWRHYSLPYKNGDVLNYWFSFRGRTAASQTEGFRPARDGVKDC